MDVTLGHDEELISFGDLDLIFKVTAGLKLPNLMNWLTDFNQICMDIILGQE